MQSLTYQQSTGIHSSVMINRAQPEPDNNHELIRAAIRAWSAAIDNQDVVCALIIKRVPGAGRHSDQLSGGCQPSQAEAVSFSG